MQKRGRFDYILLETTGLADPGTLICNFDLILVHLVHSSSVLFIFSLRTDCIYVLA